MMSMDLFIRSVRMKTFIGLSLCLAAIQQIRADIKLPVIIRDSMVLQRNVPIRIWGRASGSEKIIIRFNGSVQTAITSADGKWQTELPPMEAGGPYIMEISGKNKLVLHDILIGDVYVCAGQSNMEHQMKLHVVRYADDVASADFPLIRQFKVPATADLLRPQEDLPYGSWKSAVRGNIMDFSAVAFFFAKALFEKYHVPIGIINASWGGIPIEAMMTEESLQAFPLFIQKINKTKASAQGENQIRQIPTSPSDEGTQEDRGITEKWFDTTYLPAGWHRIAIPGYWADQGARDLNGIVWYRRMIHIDSATSRMTARVFLGRIVDADELYVNGVKVGATSYMYPQRRYGLPAGLLKPGNNFFVIRITCAQGKGGFVPDKPYQLIAGSDSVDLTGYWEYKPGMIYPTPFHTAAIPPAALDQNQPCAVFNGMLAPLVSYSIRGFVWYQGETDTADPDLYSKLQPALISGWRSKWREGSLPFLFVQLPGFGEYHYLPSASRWAEFREAQTKTLSVPNTAMAVTIDLGEWNDIHPDRKKEVGERLARASEELVYGNKWMGSGPSFSSSAIEGNKIIVSFRQAEVGGLCTSDGEPPAEFSIAGQDKKFVWAETKMENDHIIVWSKQVEHPKYVRYAWSDHPVNPNVYNRENLPALPFRTDQ